jgi:hypothetical protein
MTSERASPTYPAMLRMLHLPARRQRGRTACRLGRRLHGAGAPGRPSAELAREPAAHGTGQQLCLADVLRGFVREPPALRQPTFRLGDGEIQVKQLRGGLAEHVELGLRSAATLTAASRSRPRRSIAATAASRSSPSNSASRCAPTSRPSRTLSSVVTGNRATLPSRPRSLADTGGSAASTNTAASIDCSASWTVCVSHSNTDLVPCVPASSTPPSSTGAATYAVRRRFPGFPRSVTRSGSVARKCFSLCSSRNPRFRPLVVAEAIGELRAFRRFARLTSA